MTNPSSLDKQETTINTPSTISYQDRLKSRCSTEWLAALTLYRHLDKDSTQSRGFDMEYCRTSAWFVRHRESGEVHVMASHCSLRWCPLCARARSNVIRHSVSEWLEHADHPKFLTMTLKHSDEPLAYQVNKLYSAFRRLRRYRSFTKLVNGGVWFFQLCRNAQRGQWHPHLHCIITGDYVPYQMLRKLWRNITGDSDILDIRVVRDPEKVAEYVARYAARPANLENLRLKHQVELYEAMHGRRLCGKWGLFTKVELSIHRCPDLSEWERIGSWRVVTELAKTDADARKIIEAWETRQPLPPGISKYDVDCFLDPDNNHDISKFIFEHPPPEKSLYD